MNPNEIAEEVQAQVLSAVQTVQEGVVSTLVWLTEQAETVLPETTLRLANHLPQASQFVDRGFETAEQLLRSQREAVPQRTARLAGRVPQATEYLDRGFETAEQLLRSQHEFASKIATALQPTTPATA